MSPVATETLVDRKPFFDTEHLKADLKGRSVRGGAATLAGQGGRFLIQMVSTVVLARLLTPADFGLIAMVTAVTGFASLFKDLGLSMATVQKAEVTHEQVSVLFWVNVAISVLIALITAALAPVIAWFYGDPRLTAVGMALSLAFVFGGLTVQHQALLRRQMRFTALAIIPIVAMVAAVMAAIISATLGAGYWALVIMELTRSATNAAAVWLVCRWWPGRPTRGAGVRGMLRFGANLTGFNILNYFARNLDNVLIGRVWGAGALGLYAKAYGLLTLPIAQINASVSAVAIPALSRLQNEPDRYRSYYCKTINLIAYLTTPLTLGLAVLSDEVIRLVFGTQWLGASRIFMILAIAAVGQPIANTCGWVFTSLGQTDRMLRWGFVSMPVITIAFALGLPWGPIGVAAAYAICVHIIRYPGYWYAYRKSPVGFSCLIRATSRPLVLSLIMLLAMLLSRAYLISRSCGVAWVCLGTLGVGSVAFSLAGFAWPTARVELGVIFRDLRLLARRRRGP